MLPVSMPLKSGLEIAASYEPLARAGGDLYDFFPLDNGQLDIPARWCVFISDTAGHGLPAAIIMGVVQAVLHSHPARIARPATLLRHSRESAIKCDTSHLRRAFVTAFALAFTNRRKGGLPTPTGQAIPLLFTNTIFLTGSIANVPSDDIGQLTQLGSG